MKKIDLELYREEPLLLSPEEIIALTGGHWEKPSSVPVISRVFFDPAKASPGGLLVTRSNEQWHDAGSETETRKTIAQLEERGCRAAMVRHSAELRGGTVNLLRVKDTWQSLRIIAAAIRDRSEAKRILVTGTEGKTGFKAQFHHLASGQAAVNARLDSNNMDRGICSTLANTKRGHRLSVIEVAAPRKMLGVRRAELVSPHLCVITEIGYEHLRKHGSLERLIRAKASVTSALLPDGACLVKSDPRYFAGLCQAIRLYSQAPIFTFGERPDDLGRLLGAEFDGVRCGWTVRAEIDGKPYRYFLPLIEQHAPLSSVGVLAALHLVGLDVEKAAERFSSLHPVETSGRLYDVPAVNGGTYRVYDQSYRNYLLGLEDFFRSTARLSPKEGGKKVLVLGHVYDEREYGRLIWEMLPPPHMRRLIESAHFDLLFTVGEKTEFEKIISGSDWCWEHFAKPKDVVAPLRRIMQQGDLLLVKGDRNEKMYHLTEELLTEELRGRVRLTNNRYLRLYKNKLIAKRDDYQKLDWLSERQMMCRFEIAEKVVDFSKVTSWIDIGCGTGDFFRYILARHPVRKVVGLDATAEFIEISRSKNKGCQIDYVVENILSYRDTRTYDLVTLSGVLQILDPDQIETVFSILTSMVSIGGQIWIDTLNYNYENTRRKNGLWRFGRVELINLLEKFNFSRIKSCSFNESAEIGKAEKGAFLYLYGVQNGSVSRKSASRSQPVEQTGFQIPEQLQGLNPIQLTDQLRFVAAAEAGNQTSWLYFFPFLYCFAKGRTQALLWEQVDNSICLYLLRQTEAGLVLMLYLPPFPFQLNALRVAEERLRRFNYNNSCTILWLEDKQRKQIKNLDYKVVFVEDEYIYDTHLVIHAKGKHFERIRRKSNGIYRMPGFSFREYKSEDQPQCRTLLRNWRSLLVNDKGIAISGYRYAKQMLNSAHLFDDDILRGQVLLIDDNICAFTFGGKITSAYGSLFITISDHAIEGLGFVQRQIFMRSNPSFLLFNDSSDGGREGLAYMKSAFRPVAKNKLYRAKRANT